MRHKAATIAALVAILPTLSAAGNHDQFKKWYPEYRHLFQRILRENCTEQYAFYLAGQKNQTRYLISDIWLGSTETSQVVFPTASCILNNSTEWMKFNMASAAMLLGLTPSILAALGPSVEETSTLLVIARRHVLGVLLAAGSPSIYPFRNIDYKETIEDIVDRKTLVHPGEWSTTVHYIILIVEYALAILAIMNNATNSYQLGIRVSCVFAPHLSFLPLLWASLGILAHVYGSWALWARMRTGHAYPKNPWGMYKWFISKHHWSQWHLDAMKWMRAQFTPSVRLPKPKTEVTEETYWSILTSWWVSVNIACHLIFGTLTFSSLLFITVRDALAVIARYLASLLVCRAILMYELACFRDRELYQEILHSRSQSEVEMEPMGSMSPGAHFKLGGRNTYREVGT